MKARKREKIRGVRLRWRNRRVDLRPTKETRIRCHDLTDNGIVCEFLLQVDPWFIHLVKQSRPKRANRSTSSSNFAQSRDTPRCFGCPRKTFTYLVQRPGMVFKRSLSRYVSRSRIHAIFHSIWFYVEKYIEDDNIVDAWWIISSAFEYVS